MPDAPRVTTTAASTMSLADGDNDGIVGPAGLGDISEGEPCWSVSGYLSPRVRASSSSSPSSAAQR